jgi:alpha-L-fucosidase
MFQTLALGGKLEVGKILTVELLGHRGKLKFTQDERSLRVLLPNEKPADHAVCFKITGA